MTLCCARPKRAGGGGRTGGWIIYLSGLMRLFVAMATVFMHWLALQLTVMNDATLNNNQAKWIWISTRWSMCRLLIVGHNTFPVRRVLMVIAPINSTNIPFVSQLTLSSKTMGQASCVVHLLLERCEFKSICHVAFAKSILKTKIDADSATWKLVGATERCWCWLRMLVLWAHLP